VAGDPLPGIWVKLRADTRPHSERGDRKYLGTSHLRDSVLVEPTHVVLLRALTGALRISGVAETASIRDVEQPYVIGITLEHCTATFGEGIGNLLMILPTSGIDGVCAFTLKMEDRQGRVFLDQEVEGKASGSAAPVSGLERSAAGILQDAMGKAIDQALVLIHEAPARWWAAHRQS